MSRILISGASGLIGSALTQSFESRGDKVVRLVRRRPSPAGNQVAWDPMRPIAPELVSGYDAVVHLSGENVAGRWTEAKKQRIRDSRVISTGNLARALQTCEKKPAAFLCASAIGYYGSRGDELLTEHSPAGTGFLPHVCREWEAATSPAAASGISVTNLRIGVVLSPAGGALKQMLLPFRLGLGGSIGAGRQWLSWIHVGDLLAAVNYILTASLAIHARPAGWPAGPVNLVSPDPATNAEFTGALARVLHRPAFLRMPAFAAKLALGELADEGLLASTRVLPEKLLNNDFSFRYADVSAALSDLLR